MVRWLEALMVEPLEAPEEMREEQMVVGVEAKTPGSANYNVSSPSRHTLVHGHRAVPS